MDAYEPITEEEMIRSKEEIEEAIKKVNNNSELLYGYREDVTAVLNWFLGGEEFDGISEKSK